MFLSDRWSIQTFEWKSSELIVPAEGVSTIDAEDAAPISDDKVSHPSDRAKRSPPAN